MQSEKKAAVLVSTQHPLKPILKILSLKNADWNLRGSWVLVWHLWPIFNFLSFHKNEWKRTGNEFTIKKRKSEDEIYNVNSKQPQSQIMFGNIFLSQTKLMLRKKQPRMLCVCFVTKCSTSRGNSRYCKASCLGPSQSRNAFMCCDQQKWWWQAKGIQKCTENNRRNTAWRKNTGTTSDGTSQISHQIIS